MDVRNRTNKPPIDWLDSIPAGWKVTPLKYTAVGSDCCFIDGDWIESKDLDSSGIKYLTTGNVGQNRYKEQGSGYISEDTFKRLGCTEVFPGDLLISRLNEPIARTCIVPDLGERIVTAVDNVIYRPNQDILDKRYICYYLNSEKFTEHANIIARGATMHRISRSMLGHLKVLIPPLNTQREIADYLDVKCSSIDDAINAAEKKAELYKELRLAIITSYVTKGVNQDRTYKNSNIPWAGDIPMDWRIAEIAMYTKSCSGGTPNRENPNYWDGGDIPWMSSGEVNKGEVYSTDECITPLALQGSSAKLLKPNSVMIALNGQGKTKGMSAILKIPATCNQSLCAFSCDEKNLTYKYLYYCFLVMYKYLRSQAGDDSREGISAFSVRKQHICLPSVAEQHSIITAIDNEIKSVDALIDQNDKLISSLLSYKMALITEHVIGKKSVTY